MLYFPFHVGDWITGTKLMSAVEKGVYMDLLTFYYSVERPITEDECKRIARAYANAEQDAMQYVLQNHFVYENGAYRHKKCDEVIAQTTEKVNEISEKRRNAAKARWNKAKNQKLDSANNANEDARAYASEEQVQSKSNADGMLTNNHKPIINNTNKQQTEVCNEGSVDEVGVGPVCSFEKINSLELPPEVDPVPNPDEHKRFELGDCYDIYDRCPPDSPEVTPVPFNPYDQPRKKKPEPVLESAEALIAECATVGVQLQQSPAVESLLPHRITRSKVREAAKRFGSSGRHDAGYFIGILKNVSQGAQHEQH